MVNTITTNEWRKWRKWKSENRKDAKKKEQDHEKQSFSKNIIGTGKNWELERNERKSGKKSRRKDKGNKREDIILKCLQNKARTRMKLLNFYIQKKKQTVVKKLVYILSELFKSEHNYENMKKQE